MARDMKGLAAALLLGAAVVVLAFGPGILDPRHAGWMLAGPLGPDPVQYVLGWRYFAASPWTLPPGLNPGYGLEIASSIFYADIIPLLALPLKALQPLLGAPQYWGLWLLGCGMAQAWLGWRLLGLATANPLARAAFAGLLAWQPMLLTRMGGHLALAGQWCLLAALFLALRGAAGRRQSLAWALLAAATSLVHAYLLAMVLAIWGADWLSRAPALFRRGAVAAQAALPAHGRHHWQDHWQERGQGVGHGRGRAFAWWLAEPPLVLAPVLAGLWAVGFFALRGGFGAPGYGELGADLLGFIAPAHWSAFWPQVPDGGHGESGDLYPGLGGLLLLAAGGLAWASRPGLPPRRLWPLLAVLVVMLAFAVTHRPTIAGHQLHLFDPPAWMLAMAGTLRASARYAWPLLYALLAGSALLLARRWGGRRTGWLLLALLVVQVADLRPGLAVLRGYVADAPMVPVERLPDPLWNELGRHYQRVRAVPAENRGEGWESIARFASRHGLPTDAVYLARIDPAAVAALRARVADGLARGEPEPGTLYILRDAESRALAMHAMNPARDMLRDIDGLTVFAPGWLAR